MSEEFFEVKVFKGNSRLPEICEVRKRAWQNSMKADLLKDPSFIPRLNNDEDEDTHIIIEDNGRIVGVGRIKMKNDFSLLSSFKDFDLSLDRPYGELERVAVDPEYGGRGLVHLIDQAVLEYVKNNGMPFLFVTVIPPRDKTVERLGYRRLGEYMVTFDTKEFSTVAFVYESK